jgi:hypothetical protein
MLSNTLNQKSATQCRSYSKSLHAGQLINCRSRLVSVHVSAVAQQQAAGSTAASVMTSSVVVFTTPGCPYCKRAKQALSEQNVSYKVGDVIGFSLNSYMMRLLMLHWTGLCNARLLYLSQELAWRQASFLAAHNSWHLVVATHMKRRFLVCIVGCA